nr:RNA-directed DNA polymerase, eukaryota, reverse transcriptase zinc-binding domain protein [Tanacetum cinerariifolium]
YAYGGDTGDDYDEEAISLTTGVKVDGGEVGMVVERKEKEGLGSTDHLIESVVLVELDCLFLSDSVGKSGGILCAWDPNSFRKVSSTVSDYFVMVRGVWLKTGVNLLIVVYAPHDLRDKRMLWDYLANADRYVWSLGSSGDYSVASMRKVIDDNRSPNVFTSTRWVKCMPIKVNVFAWKVKMDALPTRFNISRRENLKSSRIVDKTAKRFNKSSLNTFHKTVGNKDIGNSFMNVVKGSGFDVLKISYLGELWVLIEFESAKVKDLFKENGGANSWFSVLNQASEDFTLGGESLGWKLRVFSLNSGQVTPSIALLQNGNILESFKIVFCGKVYWMRAKEVPGWSPEFTKEKEEDDVSVEDNHGGVM